MLAYCVSTRELKLTFGRNQEGLQAYSDADDGAQFHRRAYSGYVFLVDGGAISWSSNRQGPIALSTCESEYMALTHAAKELIWLRYLLAELFHPFKNPSVLYGDNSSSIDLIKNGRYHAKTKHIDKRYHFIRDVVDQGVLTVEHIPGDENRADILTKGQKEYLFKKMVPLIGLHA